jgi:hypothetical protein
MSIGTVALVPQETIHYRIIKHSQNSLHCKRILSFRMSRSGRSTPTRPKQKAVSDDDFSQAFFTRALYLTASLYDYPQTTDLSLPPVAARPATPPPAEKAVEFASPVADLRLRRRIDSHSASGESRAAELDAQLSAVADAAQSAEELVSLTEVFGVPFIRVPVRARLDDADEPANRRVRRHTSLEIRKIAAESQRRLRDAEGRGVESARKRRFVLEQRCPSEPSYRSPAGKSERSPGDVDRGRRKDAFDRRAALKLYRAREDYLELARPKTQARAEPE